MIYGALFGILIIGFLIFIANDGKDREQSIARAIAAVMVCASGGAILGGFFA